MIHKGKRTAGGTMSADQQAKVDILLDEFVTLLNEISDARQLQRGIARSSLPCSLVVVRDKKKLLILAQLRMENLSTMYLEALDMDIAMDQALSKAAWEFGFEDPFVLEFPAGLLDMPSADRKEELSRLASQHLESEFLRFLNLLTQLRTRPLFGAVPLRLGEQSITALVPDSPQGDRIYDIINKAAEKNRMQTRRISRIRANKTSLRQAWISLCEAKMVVADLSTDHPEVLYGLGIAHTLGRDCIHICPAGQEALELDRTRSLAYHPSDPNRLEDELDKALKEWLSPLAE